MLSPKVKKIIALAVSAAAFLIISEVFDSWMENGPLIGRRVLGLEEDERASRVEANRLARNELAKRARRARANLLEPGPIFENKALIDVVGLKKLRAISDKFNILNDGTYLILQNSAHLLFGDQSIKPNLCSTLITQPRRINRLHYHGGKCKDFDNQFGNRLGWVYGMKSIAYAAQIPFYFTCDMYHGEAPNGAAYLMSLNPQDGEIGPTPKNTHGEHLTLEQVCRQCANRFCGWNTKQTYYSSDAMISDWDHIAQSTLTSAQDHDDAVIHLRLGDSLYTRYGHSEDKGLFPHGTYIKLLKEAQKEKGTIASIGIVTAPFKGKFIREFYDKRSTSTSEVIASDLVNALQEAFPDAKITIRNSPDETIAHSLTRIVNARLVAICGCSTFCPYPLLATKGIGYMFSPPSTRWGQNGWIDGAAERYKNFRLFESPMLNGLVIDNWKTGKKLDMAGVLDWLRRQDPDAGNFDIQSEPIFRGEPLLLAQ